MKEELKTKSGCAIRIRIYSSFILPTSSFPRRVKAITASQQRKMRGRTNLWVCFFPAVPIREDVTEKLSEKLAEHKPTGRSSGSGEGI
jgi:hypothetical protein